MTPFTIEDLTQIARETIGTGSIVLTEEMSAQDVPGWDSLNHTLISLEIGAQRGFQAEPRALAEARNFGELVAMVNRIGG